MSEANEASESVKEKGKELERTKCEIYSRVVGYYRPVAQWNDGKQSEFADRIPYEPKERAKQ